MNITLLNAKDNVTESRVIVNIDLVQKCFYSLQFTSAGKGRAPGFCRKSIFRFSLDLHISERETGITHRKGNTSYNQ